MLCPDCGRAMSKHRTVLRKVRFFKEGKPRTCTFELETFRCKRCGHSHRLLPAGSIVPYKHYSLDTIVQTLDEGVGCRDTGRGLDDGQMEGMGAEDCHEGDGLPETGLADVQPSTGTDACPLRSGRDAWMRRAACVERMGSDGRPQRLEGQVPCLHIHVHEADAILAA